LLALSIATDIQRPRYQNGTVDKINKPLDIVLVSNATDFIFNSWIGLVIPGCSPNSYCQCVNTDSALFVTVYRFDNHSTELVKPDNIFTIDSDELKLYNFLSRRPWFISKPGMRAALAFSESDKSVTYQDTGNPFLSEIDMIDIPNVCALRNKMSQLSYSNLLDRYSCHEGEKWLAVFPREGYAHLAITIVGFMVFDQCSSIPAHRNKFHYYVKLHGTNTHRWIRPDQLLSHIPH